MTRALNECNLQPGAKVLDFPCGTGRLSPMIVDRGFLLTAADSSPHMVDQATQAWARQVSEKPAREGKGVFEVRDIMASGYADGEFDAVICNRLLHHFTESATRVKALTELRRISKRWVIASFFNAGALDALRSRVTLFLTGKKKEHRVPIPMGQFLSDARASGLRLVRSLPTRGRISPQWYVLLERDDAPKAG